MALLMLDTYAMQMIQSNKSSLFNIPTGGRIQHIPIPNFTQKSHTTGEASTSTTNSLDPPSGTEESDKIEPAKFRVAISGAGIAGLALVAFIKARQYPRRHLRAQRRSPCIGGRHCLLGASLSHVGEGTWFRQDLR